MNQVRSRYIKIAELNLFIKIRRVNVFRKKPSKIHFFFQNNQWLSNDIELKRDDKGNGKKGGDIKKEKSKSYILSLDNDVWGNWSILNKTGIKVLYALSFNLWV